LNIIYRDLKPDNIGRWIATCCIACKIAVGAMVSQSLPSSQSIHAGFDSAGTLKLFDFGLAKRLDSVEQDQDGNFLLTGNTGSLRYMAPEGKIGVHLRPWLWRFASNHSIAQISKWHVTNRTTYPSIATALQFSFGRSALCRRRTLDIIKRLTRCTLWIEDSARNATKHGHGHGHS
jgi:serine/threonine protein kinase